MTITCYEGEYGPTIRLDIKTSADLTLLCQLVWKLAVEDVVQDDLCKVLGCDSEAIQSLIVECVPERPSKAIELKGHGSEGRIFSWASNAAGWQDLAERLDAILLVGFSGPRYLTREDVDDAFVELCYRE